MGPLAAGRLNRRATIQEPGRASNGQGGWTATGWQDVTTVWAEVLPLSGDEALQAGVERSVQQWRVTIRRRDSVTTKNRLLVADVAFDIKSAVPHPQHRDGTLLICETGAAV